MDQKLSAIVQTICRIGLGQENAAFRHQVERLAEALRASNEVADAEAVDRLLKTASAASTMQPSRLTTSLAFAGTEVLSERTAVPVDKETGAPLAEIVFPNSKRIEMPILEESVRVAVDSMVIEWNHFDRLREMGVSPPNSCLLYGLPGTGKTQIALWMANSLGLPVVLARLDGLVSSFLGNTARNIATLFRFANRYQCLFLLDEFDAIAKVRDDPQEVGEIKRVVNTILQNIDLRHDRGLTVAITNHEQLLDPAVWRRFQVRIRVPAPAYQERQLIVQKYFPPVELSDIQVRFVAWLAEGMTGADIEVMSQNIKRFLAVQPDKNLIDALRHNSLTHAGRETARHRQSILLPKEQLMGMLSNSPELKLRQRDIGALFDTSASTAGRRVRKEKAKVAA